MATLTAGLGQLEMLLLLAVLQLDEQGMETYGSAIRDEVEHRTHSSVPRGSLYVTLDRLEDKGLLRSRETSGSAARGFRPKRVFKITALGVRSVKRSVAVTAQMQRGLEAVLGLG